MKLDDGIEDTIVSGAAIGASLRFRTYRYCYWKFVWRTDGRLIVSQKRNFASVAEKKRPGNHDVGDLAHVVATFSGIRQPTVKFSLKKIVLCS